MSSSDNLDTGIVVFCTNGNVMFSSNGELIQSNKKVRKHKNYGNVLHPVFSNMLEFTTNDFWIKFLNSCSKNKFPKNFNFINGSLLYKSKQKKQQSCFKIDEENLKENFEQLKVFLKDKGILPSEEKLEIFSAREEKIIDIWKDIGKKNENNYIYQYIDREQKKNNLNEKEKNNLHSLVKIGLAGGIFNDNTIKLKDNKIDSLEYLLWHEEKRSYSIDKNFFDPKMYKLKKSKQTNNSSSSTIDENDLDTVSSIKIEKIWEKFIHNYYKI